MALRTERVPRRLTVEIERLVEAGSTQDLLHARAARGAAAGTVIVAESQTMGRGSRGREWMSPVGGLWMSVLLRPATEPALEVLSLRVALAVAAAVEGLLPGCDLRLKWPNDLLLLDRKLGGILCEARWQGGALGWIAVGVGINVRNPPPAALAHQAVALREVVPWVTVDALVQPLAGAVAGVQDQSGHLTARELAAFARRDWLRGRPLASPEPGRADGVAADGSLQVRRADGAVVHCRRGTVQLAAG